MLEPWLEFDWQNSSDPQTDLCSMVPCYKAEGKTWPNLLRFHHDENNLETQK